MTGGFGLGFAVGDAELLRLGNTAQLLCRVWKKKLRITTQPQPSDHSPTPQPSKTALKHNYGNWAGRQPTAESIGIL